MILRRYRTCLGWLGIVLVLAQLLAPGVSHALRHADALRSASSHALLADLCSTMAADGHAGQAGAADTPPSSAGQDAPCGYCLHPVGHVPLASTATPDQPRPAPARVQALRTDPDRPAAAPARHHSPRAPPTLA